MINRVLIRIKTVQMVYAYYQSDSKDLVKAEKDFFYSLEKSYELYNYLLQLIPAITNYAEQRIEFGKNKYLPSYEEKNPNCRFIENSFARQLESNKYLVSYINNRGISWVNNEPLIKNLYEEIITSDFYEQYMSGSDNDYESDKEIWKKIFKKIIQHNESLREVLEDQSIFWNDDIDIVLTFVVKTIKKFSQEGGNNQLLLPMYKDDADKIFAADLFKGTIVHGPKYRALIDEALKNWDLERLALMDLLILQVALTEINEIEGIPVNVTMNEYIDIAKIYSTLKSGTFVNGILDQIVTQLRSQNKLFKS